MVGEGRVACAVLGLLLALVLPARAGTGLKDSKALLDGIDEVLEIKTDLKDKTQQDEAHKHLKQAEADLPKLWEKLATVGAEPERQGFGDDKVKTRRGKAIDAAKNARDKVKAAREKVEEALKNPDKVGDAKSKVKDAIDRVKTLKQAAADLDEAVQACKKKWSIGSAFDVALKDAGAACAAVKSGSEKSAKEAADVDAVCDGVLEELREPEPDEPDFARLAQEIEREELEHRKADLEVEAAVRRLAEAVDDLDAARDKVQGSAKGDWLWEQEK